MNVYISDRKYDQFFFLFYKIHSLTDIRQDFLILFLIDDKELNIE